MEPQKQVCAVPPGYGTFDWILGTLKEDCLHILLVLENKGIFTPKFNPLVEEF